MSKHTESLMVIIIWCDIWYTLCNARYFNECKGQLYT